ncbi:MAG: beta-lactamase family protein [Candidatus Hydrogenedentes bacterium]|nr:beta-lactamase family protein [Candidatus Hydrogenedentota bacterium]
MLFVLNNIGTVVYLAVMIGLVFSLLGVVFPIRAIRCSRRIRRRLHLRWIKKSDEAVGRVHIAYKILSNLACLLFFLLLLFFLKPHMAIISSALLDSSTPFASVNCTDDADAAVFQREMISLVRSTIEADGCTGVSVGIITPRGRAVMGFGRKDLRLREAPDGDTLYEIGSITKVFTAVSLAALIQEGVVALDTPVDTLIPETQPLPEWKQRRITLEDLSMHTSGLPRMPSNFFNIWQLLFLESLRDPYARHTCDDMFQFLHNYRLTRKPGEAYEYSNLGAGLLGYVLSRAARMSYEDLVRQRVLEPLEMHDTAINLTGNQKNRMACGYADFWHTGSLCVGLPVTGWHAGECFQGAGMLRSTVNDLMKFMEANMELTDTALKPILELTHTQRHDIQDNLSIGLGWHCSQKENIEGAILWHNGATGGFRSFLGFSPTGGIGVVALSSSSFVDAMCWRLFEKLLPKK